MTRKSSLATIDGVDYPPPSHRIDPPGSESDSKGHASSCGAEIVRDALVTAGIRGEVIEIGHYGANNPLVPTPRGVPELRNRRVEVTIR